MTVLAYSDRQSDLIKKAVGNRILSVPEGDFWVDATPEEFERQARNLASGLMVKGIRRGVTVCVKNATEPMMAFISFACRLAHLEVGCNESAFVIDASNGSINYLLNIGAAWAQKYRAVIDRSMRQIELGNYSSIG